MHISSGTLFEIPFTLRIAQLLQQLEYHAFSFMTPRFVFCRLRYAITSLIPFKEVKPLRIFACAVSPSSSLSKTPGSPSLLAPSFSLFSLNLMRGRSEAC